MVYEKKVMLFIALKKWNPLVYNKMDCARGQYTNCNNPQIHWKMPDSRIYGR